MSGPDQELLAAFRRDHAVLRRGLHDLAVALRDGGMLAAKRAAAALDRDVGPHIAFEEQVFYPAMRSLIGAREVDRLYADHRVGQAAIAKLLALPDLAWPAPGLVAELLEMIEVMERHAAECGELSWAMGRMPAADQTALLDQLVRLRAASISWTEMPDPGDRRPAR